MRRTTVISMEIMGKATIESQMTRSAAIVEKWKKKAHEYSFLSNDPLVDVMFRGIDVMSSFFNGSDQSQIQQALEAFELSRSTHYEETDEPSMRSIMFGVMETLHKTLLLLIEKRNQIRSEEFPAKNNEIEDYSQLFPLEPKEEPIDDFSQDFSVNNQISGIASAEYNFDLKEEDMLDDFMDYGMHHTPFKMDNSLNEVKEEVMADFDETMNEGYYVDAMDDLFEDGEDLGGPPKKELRLDFAEINKNVTPQCIFCDKYPETAYAYASHLYNKHKSSLKSSELYLLCSCGFKIGSSCRDVNHDKECNSQEFTLRKRELIKNYSQGTFDKPQCILCKKYPSTLSAYTSHLYQHHKSTLGSNGIFLSCSCGSEVHSSRDNHTVHSKKCDGSKFTIHYERELVKISDSPQCIFCEKYPSTMCGYAYHLQKQHKSTLKENKSCLLCSCGEEVDSKNYRPTHNKKCAGIEFSLLKVTKTITSTPQCILCEKHPSNAYNYAHHLMYCHKTSLRANKIYLLCSCGQQVRTSQRSIYHYKECDASQFTIENYPHAVPMDILYNDYNVE